MLNSPDNILSVRQLHVEFETEGRKTSAVKGLDFDLKRGSCLGIVGESGSGKSVTALSIMRLLAETGNVPLGEIHFHPAPDSPYSLLELTERKMQDLRGRYIAMVFQEPMTSLNPVIPCGKQVAEALRRHRRFSRSAAKKEVLTLFEKVKLPQVERIFRSYPHQLSGGQKQRVMIAMAISCSPEILIADEPTTALDVTVQREILELLRELQSSENMSILFITHDLGVVAEIADEVLVMRHGIGVEHLSVEQLFEAPTHPYTKGLLACRPRMGEQPERLPLLEDLMENVDKSEESASVESPVQAKTISSKPLMVVNELETRFGIRKSPWKRPEYLTAVNKVSFELYEGETLGLVGESGCGKTTLGRSLLRLVEPYKGEIMFQGQSLMPLSQHDLRKERRHIQMIFQDPYGSLQPRMRVGDAIVEPMKVHGMYGGKSEWKQKTMELLEAVGLLPEHYERYPHEFSGGQRQRICIARALALNPKLVVCDESVSALDVSMQAQVLNLLKQLQSDRGLTYLFISHDLSVVRFMSDRIMVMKSGEIVESGPAKDICESPQHPYTQKLLEAVPVGSLERVRNRLNQSR